jgi:hypothetical protein
LRISPPVLSHEGGAHHRAFAVLHQPDRTALE